MARRVRIPDARDVSGGSHVDAGQSRHWSTVSAIRFRCRIGEKTPFAICQWSETDVDLLGDEPGIASGGYWTEQWMLANAF
jgi:hypothetical protein